MLSEIKQGNKYKCIETVRMNGNGAVAYRKGKIYNSQMDGNITDEMGTIEHSWSIRAACVYFIQVGHRLKSLKNNNIKDLL